MKKLLLSLLLVLTVGCVSAIAETITITPSDPTGLPTQGYDSSTFTKSDVTFTATNIMKSGQIKVKGTGSGAFNLHNTTAISGIKKITLTANASTLGTWYMKTSATAAVTEQATTNDIAGVTSGSTVTFTVPEGTDASYFHINLTTAGKGTVRFTKIEIEYTNSGTVDPVDPTALAKPVIKYGDVTVSEDDNVSVPAGTTFNISADNAESITITNADDVILLSETGSTCTWTPTATAEDLIIVTATKEGAESTLTSFILDTRIETDFNFTVGSVGHDINDGKSLAAEKLKNGSDFNSLEPIAWSSSNTKVATIDEATGAITIIATGSTIIRADFKGNKTTKPGYAEYTLNVADRNIHVTTFNFITNDYGMTRHTTGEEYNPNPFTFGNGWIGVKTTGKNTNRLWSNKGLRVYTGATLTICAPEGCTLTSVRVLKADGSLYEARTKNITIDETKATATYKHTISSKDDLAQIEVSYIGATDPADATDEALAAKFQAGSSLSLTVKDGEVIEGTYTKSANADAEVSIANSYPHAKIYYSWTADVTETPEVAPLAAEAGYTEYTAPLSFDRAGTLSYYAEVNGQRTENKTLTITGPTTTGISEIEADGVATEWFDLSGRRVAAPAKGVYLRKQGSKVTKIAY